jgi:hypothetical protein
MSALGGKADMVQLPNLDQEYDPLWWVKAACSARADLHGTVQWGHPAFVGGVWIGACFDDFSIVAERRRQHLREPGMPSTA